MTKIIRLLLFSALCFSSLYSADEESPITRERTQKAIEQYQAGEDMGSDTNFYDELWNILFALAVIVALMVVATWFLRRFMQGRMEQMNISSTIKILEQRNLSTKSVLYIVEVYDKHILIGESSAGVAGIAEFPVEEEKTFQQLMEKKE